MLAVAKGIFEMNYFSRLTDIVTCNLAEMLAREAWKKEIYSEGQLARLLQLNRHEIREILDGAEKEESEANELVKLPQ